MPRESDAELTEMVVRSERVHAETHLENHYDSNYSTLNGRY